MESLRNSFQNQWELVWRALGIFPHGTFKEFLSKSIEICLESSWSISLCNPQGNPLKVIPNWIGDLYANSLIESFLGVPFKINANWSGALSANSLIESFRNSFQIQWKFAWGTLGQLPL